MNFIVLSSSRGTTFHAVIDKMQNGELTAKCLGLITDRGDRGAVEKARKADIPVTVVERIKGESREEYDYRLNSAIEKLGQIDVLAAIGWMFILSPWFVNKWAGRIINVHPALLPKYPGAHGIEEALASGDKVTGMTIHIIDEGVDTGTILVQKTCSILPSDTVDSLKTRVQALEKEWYPKVLEMIENGKIKMSVN